MNSNLYQYKKFSNSMGDCLKEFWLSFFDFDGRATRSEFWWSCLWYGIFGSFLFSSINLESIWYIIILIPFLSITTRRLHDSNNSALNILLVFFPIFGALIFLLLLVLESDKLKNKYGKPRI